jgi:hypothetical protein
VECSGTVLNPEVKLISLKLVRLPSSTVLALLNLYSDSCFTFSKYSACSINHTVLHKSCVKVLVHDLDEGEGREYGCTANTVDSMGEIMFHNWKHVVTRRSKLIVVRGVCMVACVVVCV